MLEGLRITGGRTAGDGEHGGGICALGAGLVLSNCVVFSNTLDGWNSYGGGAFVLGSAVTYTLACSNAGCYTATGVLVTDLVPVELVGVGYQASGVAITRTAGITYAWQAADLAPGQGGVITLTGVISPGLAPRVFTNTARISTTAVEGDLRNNGSSAALGACQRITPRSVMCDWVSWITS